jgi:hypothetical protein
MLMMFARVWRATCRLCELKTRASFAIRGKNIKNIPLEALKGEAPAQMFNVPLCRPVAGVTLLNGDDFAVSRQDGVAKKKPRTIGARLFEAMNPYRLPNL